MVVMQTPWPVANRTAGGSVEDLGNNFRLAVPAPAASPRDGAGGRSQKFDRARRSARRHGPYSAVLGYLFPQDADYFTAQAQEAGLSRLWAGIHFRSDIEAGLEIGRAVGEEVIESARNDGSQ
jgi:hypothetical protein